MREGTTIARPRAPIFIKRPRLTKLLDEAGARILLLVAPAGYGKTTLAREWTEEQDRVGWYSGAPAMIDVAGLSVGIAEVLGAMGERPRPDMVERVRILAARGHDARGLAKAASSGAPGEDWLLVVDDYHHALDSEDAEAFFEELVSLTEFRLLITSRERPSWLAARKVVYGEAAVIEMDALAFTDEEAFAVMGGRGDAIVAEARGWPAVIGLAAMRKGDDVAAGLAPDDLYRFFAEDLFENVSPPLREALFLLALAGVDGAQTSLGKQHAGLLAEATERGFVSSGERTSVHPLLRGFLLTKLSDADENTSERVVREAIGALVKNGNWDACLRALQQLPRKELIVCSLRSGLAEMLDSGRIATISAWLELAAQTKLEDPLLLLAEAEVALRQHDYHRARALGERAGSLLDGDLGSRSYLVAAFAAHFKDRPDETTRLAGLALEAAISAQQQVACLWLHFNSTLEQFVPDTEPLLERLQRFPNTDASHALRLQTAKGLILCQTGRVRASIGELELASGLLPDVRDPFARTNLLQFLTYTYLLGARYQDAIDASERLAVESRESGLRFAGEYAVLRRAAALIGLRRLGPAQAAIERIRVPSEATADFITSNVVIQRVRLAITAGDLERAASLLVADIKGGDRPAFRGEVRGYRALIAAALGHLDRTELELNASTNDEQYVEASALNAVARAVLSLRRGEARTEALNIIEKLLSGGEADAIVMGYRAWPELAHICVGTEVGAQIAELLSAARDIGIARAVGLSIPREARPREALSPREQEVCDLLSQGLGNRAIAKALFISESTTKVHVRHIFEKLGVRSRAEVARIAGARSEG